MVDVLFFDGLLLSRCSSSQNKAVTERKPRSGSFSVLNSAPTSVVWYWPTAILRRKRYHSSEFGERDVKSTSRASRLVSDANKSISLASLPVVSCFGCQVENAAITELSLQIFRDTATL